MMTPKVGLKLFSGSMIFFAGAMAFATPTSAVQMGGCSLNGIPLKGKVQVVESFPDIKVEVVESFPDINVKKVSSFPDDCGEWQFVESFPDFKVQFVDSFPDLKVKYVTSFPGMEND